MSFISNTYLTSLFEGVIYGSTICTASCLPYIASYIAGINADLRKSLSVTLIFNGGRVVAYTLIGALIALLTGVFRYIITDSTLSPFQIYSSIAFSILTIAIGVHMLIKSRSTRPQCELAAKNAVLEKPSGRFDVRAFTLGLSRGLVLCPPLLSILLVYAVPFSAPLDSLFLAVLFGLGTAISPLLILGASGTGWLLNKAPLFRRWVSIAGAAILIVLGLGTLISSLLGI
jgi:cytochrome c-type biogenesis protein